MKHKTRLFTYTLCLILLTVPWLIADTGQINPSLHQLARWGQETLMEMLLENGADPSAVDIMGRTALHYGARHPKVVAVLTKHGADPNISDRFGNTPLHLAIVEHESVRLLIEAGADVNIRNQVNRSPLDISLRQGSSRRNRRTVELLLKAGAQ